jgi:pyruvate, orthophosphate dikinase
MTEVASEPFFVLPADASPEANVELVGSKAAQLARMSRLGLPVPPAFVMPTSLCNGVNRKDEAALRALKSGLRLGIARLESATGRRLGDSRLPLFVSVRSGAAKSMPGMLDTILDVGMNNDTVQGLIRLTGNPRLAWDSYRRFVQSHSEVVGGVPSAEFERPLAAMLRAEDAASEDELDCEALERLTHDFIEIASRAPGLRPPEDPLDQLDTAALAVYASWDSARAREYRQINGLHDLAGTAVTVQAMVFGNSGNRSGAGVAFSRNPATGANEPYVDFLFDAQGEDVVSGRRTPGDASLLAKWLPEIAQDLAAASRRLEQELKDVQDIEFTVEDGKLYFLQTRSAKRTPRAALRIAVDLVREGLIAPAEALRRLEGVDLERAGVATLRGETTPLATAISASPGVASGRIALDSETAQRMAEDGAPVILVRREPSTDDVAGFNAAAGILTMVGGRTAHAAVVARQLGKACLVGCGGLEIDENNRRIRLVGRELNEGDWLSIDGESGEISAGRAEIVIERPEAELAELKRWSGKADKRDQIPAIGGAAP